MTKTMNDELASYRSKGNAVSKLNIRIPQGHFLVYYFLPRDEVMCDPKGSYLNGSNEAGVLFDSFSEVEAYAKAFVESSGQLGAGVFDSSWKVVARFIPERIASKQRNASSPSYLLTWSAVLLLLGSLLLWLEIRSGWTLVVGFLIGFRLLLSGILKCFAGFYRLRTGQSLK